MKTISECGRAVESSLAAAILMIFLLATGCCGARPADKQFHADALKVDARYAQDIHFSGLGVRVSLAAMRMFGWTHW